MFLGDCRDVTWQGQRRGTMRLRSWSFGNEAASVRRDPVDRVDWHAESRKDERPTDDAFGLYTTFLCTTRGEIPFLYNICPFTRVLPVAKGSVARRTVGRKEITTGTIGAGKFGKTKTNASTFAAPSFQRSMDWRPALPRRPEALTTTIPGHLDHMMTRRADGRILPPFRPRPKRPQTCGTHLPDNSQGEAREEIRRNDEGGVDGQNGSGHLGGGSEYVWFFMRSGRRRIIQ